MRFLLFSLAMLTTLPIPTTSAQDQPPAGGAPQAPDLGFDYRAFVAEHLRLVSEGESQKALDHLQQRTRAPFPNGEDIKKQFAAVYGLGGAYEGHEFVGYRRVSSRAYKTYFFVKYENQALLFTYYFVYEKSLDKWCLTGALFTGNFEMFDNVAPFHPLEETWKDPPDKKRA